MAKLPRYLGFYTPHARADFTGELVNPKTGEVYTPPSMTKQDQMAACDINNIIRDFKITGQIQHMSLKAREGAYVDLPDSVDFQEALHQVQRAREAFAALPSAVRTRFDNDPAGFLTFMQDPKNKDEIIKMGLANAPVPPAGSPAPSAGAVGAAAPTPSQTQAPAA